MAALRSLLFLIVFHAGTVVAVLISLLLGLVSGRALRRFVGGWAAFHRAAARWILGVRTRVEGEVPRGAVLVAAKHQSMFETLEVVVLLDEPAVVMKRQLADIPFFGRVTRRYGVIPVDRAGGAAALRAMMRAAGEAIAGQRPIVIFPEGTRVAPGEQPPLQPGFAGLYRALKLPVVPLALDSGRLWPRKALTKRSGIVTFRFGPATPAGLPRAEIEAAVHEAINALER